MDEKGKSEKRSSEEQDKLSYWGRAGALVSGFSLVGLGTADAIFDPFPGPETAMFTTGIALIAMGITGRRRRDQKDDGNDVSE